MRNSETTGEGKEREIVPASLSLSLSFERKHEKDPPAVSRDADSVANGPTLTKALGLFFF